MSSPVDPLDSTNPNNPINSINSQDSTTQDTQTMINNLQTLNEILNNPESSKDEKAKLVDAILKNIEQTLSSSKGSFSPALVSNIKSCASQASQYVQCSDLPKQLNDTINNLQNP